MEAVSSEAALWPSRVNLIYHKKAADKCSLLVENTVSILKRKKKFVFKGIV